MESANDERAPQDRLIGDLRLVIENAEELLKNTGQYMGEPYRKARERLTGAIKKASAELERFEEARLASMMDATRAAIDQHADNSGEARIMRAFHQK